ncbi:MAG: hypothetical protein KGI90_10100 [Burkholderiales bacterium]|nr:hypothetical protein [Burkholderiales bacterium]
MTTRKRPDPYAGVEDVAAILRVAADLLHQWQDSGKPWPLMAAFVGAHRARAGVDAADRGGHGATITQGTRIAVERLERQTRMEMLAHAEEQMLAPAVALEAQPQRTAVDLREALRRDYAATRLQQAAWQADPTRPPPQSHTPNAVHKRIAAALGVSVSAVNAARVAWLGEHRPPAGTPLETWQPVERGGREWAASMRVVREVQRRGIEIEAARAAAAKAPRTVVAPKAKAPRPDFDFSRRAGRKERGRG